MLESMWTEILNMSLTASAAILVVCLIRQFLKGVPKIFSYVLWAVVLFRLLCPVSLESEFSLFNVVDSGAAVEQGWVEYISSKISYRTQSQVQPEALASGNTVNETVSGLLSADDSGDTVDGTVSGSLSAGGSGDTVDGTVSGSLPAETSVDKSDENGSVILPAQNMSDTADVIVSASLPADSVQIVLSVTAWVWLAGVLAMAAYQMISFLHLKKRLRGAELKEGNIYCLQDGGTPFVYGVIRPRIYLPSGLSEGERRYMLLHEQIHIRRGDQIFRFLGCAALCLHWFNPLVWLAFYFSGKDMELSCDEAVLKRLGNEVKKQYSGSLLALAAAGSGGSFIGHVPVAFGEVNVKSRIRNVLRYQKTRPVVAAAAAVVCVAVVAALALNPRTEASESGSVIDQSAVEEDTTLDDESSGSGSEEISDTAEGTDTADGTADTYTVVIADDGAADAEVPDVVLSAAQEWIAYYMEIWQTDQEDAAFREMYGTYDYADYRISCLERVCTYENLDGADYEVWLVDFQFLVDDPSAILIMPGSMEIDSEGWLQATYPNSYYLIFEKTEDALVFETRMVFQEAGPAVGTDFNESGFTSDLRMKLANAAAEQTGASA